MQEKTYITEANVVAVIVVWIAQTLGLNMSGEVAAAFAVSIVSAMNIAIRFLSKKGWI
jgi:hypothetical protein